MTTRMVVLIAIVAMSVVVVPRAFAQNERFEISGHVAIAKLDGLDVTDRGVGAIFSWLATHVIGVDAELTVYPQDIPDRVPFSGGRVEALFGATAGPRIGALRPFAKVRPGFVTFGPAPQPIACILIFPPPLACELAGGRTMLALDVGGGLESDVGHRAVFRVDASDRMIKYPGPSLVDGRVENGSFFNHDLRVSVGAGVRF